MRICHINQFDEFVPGTLGAIDKYFIDRYQVKYVKNNCDVTISGPYEENIVKPEPGSIKIWYTGEARLPRITYWEKIIFLLAGNYIVSPDYDYWDLVIGFNRINHDKWLRYPYYMLEPGEILFSTINRPKCQPKKEYFACFLVSSNYKFDGCKKRNEIFYELSKYKFVAAGGVMFNNIGEIVPREKEKTDEFFKKCKFIIASENQTFDGYITEKLPNAYMAGSIPIYYGDTNVDMDFNKKAFIDYKDFTSMQTFVDYIKKVDQDDELYCSMYNQPLVINTDSYKDLNAQLYNKLDEIIKRVHK